MTPWNSIHANRISAWLPTGSIPALAFAVLCLWNSPAAADFRLCNNTSSRVGIALGYDRGGEWSGQAFMCSRDKEFTIKGTDNCLARGFDRTGFFEVDTGEQRAWTVQLTESNEQPGQRVPGIPGTVGPGGPGGVPGLSNPQSGPGLPPAAAPKQ